jgi:hypothetical protein
VYDWLLSTVSERPTVQRWVVWVATKETDPSPDRSQNVDDAPALPQRVDAVLTRLLPETATPTAFVHTTGWPAGRSGMCQLPDTATPASVAPWL